MEIQNFGDIDNEITEQSEYLGLHSEIVFYIDESYIHDLQYDIVKDLVVEEYGEENIDKMVDPDKYYPTEIHVRHDDI